MESIEKIYQTWVKILTCLDCLLFGEKPERHIWNSLQLLLTVETKFDLGCNITWTLAQLHQAPAGRCDFIPFRNTQMSGAQHGGTKSNLRRADDVSRNLPILFTYADLSFIMGTKWETYRFRSEKNIIYCSFPRNESHFYSYIKKIILFYILFLYYTSP
jgi:hypothetical protein